MPITKSAKKALRQSKKRRVVNLRRTNKMKELIKQIRTFVKDKNKAGAQKLLSETYQAIDKAAKRGVIKQNTASRKKSRLTKSIAKLS